MGQLNAWDIDGDRVEYTLSSDNDPKISQTLALKLNGELSLADSLTNFLSSEVNFKVTLTDDGSSCGNDRKSFKI